MIRQFNFTIFADGGSRGNPGEAAYGFVVYDKNGNTIFEEGVRIGIATNNTAEYNAIIAALKWIENNLLKSGPLQKPQIQFYLDSELAVMQLNGKYKVKNENLRNLFFTIKNLEQKIGGDFFYSSIKREKNKAADKLVNLALDGKI